MYARDVSKKVRYGYRQKQKDKGVCNMPPMGYYKDKLKDEIVIMDEPAEIVICKTVLHTTEYLKRERSK